MLSSNLITKIQHVQVALKAIQKCSQEKQNLHNEMVRCFVENTIFEIEEISYQLRRELL